MPPAEIEVVREQRAVVGADVQAHRQRRGGVDAGGGAVERALADGDAHAARALVAEAEDPLVVGDHDEADVAERCVAEDGVDPATVRRRDPEPARPPEDVTELLARAAHRRRVHDREELLEVVAEHAIEEVLVPVLERREADVLLERIALAPEVLEHAPRLLLDRVHRERQQAVEAERGALLGRERAALVVHGLAQQMRAAMRDVRAVRLHHHHGRLLRCGGVRSAYELSTFM